MKNTHNWIKIEFDWKKNGMHIGGKGIERLQGNMVLNLFFEKTRIQKKIFPCLFI